jgi:hypothetical protein
LVSGYKSLSISKAAIAGIVLGVAGGILIALGITRVWFSRRRKAPMEEVGDSVSPYAKHELDAKEKEQISPVELDASSAEVVELDVQENSFAAAELDATSTYYEMSGDEWKGKKAVAMH